MLMEVRPEGSKKGKIRCISLGRRKLAGRAGKKEDPGSWPGQG